MWNIIKNPIRLNVLIHEKLYKYNIQCDVGKNIQILEKYYRNQNRIKICYQTHILDGDNFRLLCWFLIFIKVMFLISNNLMRYILNLARYRSNVGGLAQMVERSLSMWEAPRSILGSSIIFYFFHWSKSTIILNF